PADKKRTLSLLLPSAFDGRRGAWLVLRSNPCFNGGRSFLSFLKPFRGGHGRPLFACAHAAPASDFFAGVGGLLLVCFGTRSFSAKARISRTSQRRGPRSPLPGGKPWSRIQRQSVASAISK